MPVLGFNTVQNKRGLNTLPIASKTETVQIHCINREVNSEGKRKII